MTIDNEVSLDDILKSDKKDIQSLKNTTKKAGRPRATNEKADQRVTLYFTKKDIDEIEKFCFNERKKVGTYIKDTFLNHFKNDKNRQNENILSIDKYLAEQNPKKIGEAILELLTPKK